ncbi:hypothetical protein ACFFX0_19180 [Citricoccus parietis]|uniref:Uncharacterized protein n=1 Tax=Citricoccus parietis TaxID=592307 RepID=A0ABV5G2P6_9MICC
MRSAASCCPPPWVRTRTRTRSTRSNSPRSRPGNQNCTSRGRVPATTAASRPTSGTMPQTRGP